jgi:hypothetical protein
VSETQVQYAAHYPLTLDDTDDFETYGPVSREEAVRLVGYVNNRLVERGFPERAEVRVRSVYITEWEKEESSGGNHDEEDA